MGTQAGPGTEPLPASDDAELLRCDTGNCREYSSGYEYTITEALQEVEDIIEYDVENESEEIAILRTKVREVKKILSSCAGPGCKIELRSFAKILPNSPPIEVETTKNQSVH